MCRFSRALHSVIKFHEYEVVSSQERRRVMGKWRGGADKRGCESWGCEDRRNRNADSALTDKPRFARKLCSAWRGWESAPFRQGGCHFPAGGPEGRSWNLLLERDSHEPAGSCNNQDTRASFQRCRRVPTWRQDFFSFRVWNKALRSFSKTVDFVFRRLVLPLELLNIQKCEMGYIWVWPSREKSCGYLERGTGPS